MKTYKSNIFLAVAVLMLMLTNCVKDEITLSDPSAYNRPVNMAAPLFNAHFSIYDLLDRMDSNDYIYVDDNNLINAKIDSTYEITYDSIIIFNDLKNINNYDITPVKASLIFRDTIEAGTIEGQRFDKVTIKKGLMKIIVESPDGFSGDWTVKFPEIVLENGDTLSFSNTIGGITDDSIKLDKGIMKFFQTDADISSFEMITIVNPTITGMPSSTMLKVQVLLDNFIPEYIEGFFGEKVFIDVDDEIDLGFFNDMKIKDMIEFKDIQFHIITRNSFGIPLTISLDTILFKDSETNKEILLQIQNNNKIELNPASYDNGVVNSKIDSLIINKDNSNIVEAVNMYPDKVHYRIKGISNLNIDPSTIYNFVLNDGNNNLYTKVKVVIPFWFKTSNYNRIDTVQFNVREKINDSTTIDYLDKMHLYFTFNNGVPFNIYTQGYFVDDNFNVIDSVFVNNQQIWKSPAINADGAVQGQEETKVIITLDYEKVKKLYDRNSTQILLKSTVKSGGLQQSPTVPEFVKLYSHYFIDISMQFDIISSDTPITTK
jgi:hypothetical protein